MRSIRLRVILILACLVLASVGIFPRVQAQAQLVPVTSSWLSNPVTLDGKMGPGEWSDSTPTDLTLSPWPSGSQTVSARVWMKNDATWLYVLERVEWVDSPDAFDAGDMLYFWPGYSDLGGVRFNNATIDYYGHSTGTTWYNDTSAPGGHNDTQGAASYDAVNDFYWFEYKRPLDSGDGYDPNTGWGYDWSFVAGGTYGATGTGLIVEFWDYSTLTPYDVNILLHLSSPDMPVSCYSLVQPVTVDGKWTSATEWMDAAEVPMYVGAGNAVGYFRVKHDASYLYVLMESLADSAVEYNSTQGYGDWMQVFLDTLHDHGLPSSDDYWLSASYVNPTLTRVGEWRGNGTDWNSVPSVLAGLQVKISLDTGNSPHAPHPHVVGEFKIPLSAGISLGSEFGFLVRLGDSSESWSMHFYWPGPSWGPQYDDPGSWGDVVLSRAELGYSLAEVPLVAGWNLVSLPLVPRTNAISTVLAALIAANEVTVVWSYTGTPRAWKSYTPGKTSTLSTMNDGDAYWIYMTKADTLGVSGAVIPPTVTPPTYTLLAGWNLVGFKPQPTVTNETVGAYLSSISSKYDPNNVWILDNSSGNWIRATDSTWIQPGEAIWIFMTASATLRP